MSANPPSDGPERPEDPTPAGAPPPPPPPPPPTRRLVRSRGDRVVAGVCGGLGRYLGIDPVLVRIAMVVLVFFGGAGVLLYIAAVLLVPDEVEAPEGAGEPPVPVERNRWLVVVGLILVVLVAGPLLFVPALFTGGIVVPLAFLALVGIGVAWLVTGRKPDRDARSLTLAALLGVGVLVLLGVLSVAAFWAAAAGGDAVVAGVVIAAGVAVLAGAFLRPVRWLILPALAVALPAGFVAAAGIDLDGGYGERTYRPGAPAAIADRYELGAGRLVVDLRDADLPRGDHRLAVRVGMGEAVVVVDEDVCVVTDADVGIGGIDVFEQGTGGIDVGLVEEGAARPGAARLVLDANVAVGHLDVRKTDPDDWHDGRDRGSRDDGRRGRNSACLGV